MVTLIGSFIGILFFTSICFSDTFTTDTAVYTNERFGVEITYPVQVFVPRESPTNLDGRIFDEKDGLFVVNGSFNLDNDTPITLQKSLLDNPLYRGITYKAKGKDWVVISGDWEDIIFYEKHIFNGNIICSFVIEHLKEEIEYFSYWTSLLSNSFKCLGPQH